MQIFVEPETNKDSNSKIRNSAKADFRTKGGRWEMKAKTKGNENGKCFGAQLKSSQDDNKLNFKAKAE